MNKVENTPLEKRNKEHYGNLEIAKLRMTSAKEKKELKPLWLKQDKHGTKEEQIRTTLRLKRDARLDKMKIT